MGSSHSWPTSTERKLNSQRSNSCPGKPCSSRVVGKSNINESSSPAGPSGVFWTDPSGSQRAKRSSPCKEDEDEEEEEKQRSLKKRSKTDDAPKKRKSKSKHALWKRVWLKKTDKSRVGSSDVDERESGSGGGRSPRYDKEKRSAPKCSDDDSSSQAGSSGVSTRIGLSTTSNDGIKRKSACDEEEEEEEQGSLRKKSKTDAAPKKRKFKRKHVMALWKKVWHKKTGRSSDSSSDVDKRERGCDGGLENKYLHTSSDISWLIEQQKRHEMQEESGLFSSPLDIREKYMWVGKIHAGGYGEVFYGVRIEDDFPVALKVIQKNMVKYTTVELPGHLVRLPAEVYFLIRAGAGPNSLDSRVAPKLLDWYELKDEIVLVQERPEPCKDLLDYIADANVVSPDTVKIILRQLVDEAIELESKGIFHRDIKPDNILVETGSDFPRARFIDFGCATLFTPGQQFDEPQGTLYYSSPEWFRQDKYTAGPTTVWQLGLLLYAMLFFKLPLVQEKSIASKRSVPIPSSLPPDCRDLLKRCLKKDPKERLSLQGVRDHPWLNSE